MIDNDILDGAFLRIEAEAELFLNGGKK